MIFSLLINVGLAMLWGAMYAVSHTPYMLFASGVASGVAVMCLLVKIVSDKYW